MTTNLLFGTNVEALGATTYSASSEAAGYNVEDLFTCGRGEHWKPVSACDEHMMGYRNADTEVNYLAVIDAVYHVLGGTAPEFELKHSSNDADWTAWKDTGSLSSSDLAGPNDKDYIYYNATSATDEYWRLYMVDSAASTPEVGKVFFGKALDIGRDPSTVEIKVIRENQALKKPIHEIRLGYKDISYANTKTFLDEVGEISDYHPIVVFTATNHQVLLNNKVMLCRIRPGSLNTPQEITARNNISFVLEELI